MFCDGDAIDFIFYVNEYFLISFKIMITFQLVFDFKKIFTIFQN